MWVRIKENVQYRRVPRGNYEKVEKINVIVIEGKIEIDEKVFGPGHYKVAFSSVGRVIGPAKFYQSDQPYILEEFRDSQRLKSERISKHMRPV